MLTRINSFLMVASLFTLLILKVLIFGLCLAFDYGLTNHENIFGLGLNSMEFFHGCFIAVLVSFFLFVVTALFYKNKRVAENLERTVKI